MRQKITKKRIQSDIGIMRKLFKRANEESFSKSEIAGIKRVMDDLIEVYVNMVEEPKKED